MGRPIIDQILKGNKICLDYFPCTDNKQVKGDAAEYYAIFWLVREGYEVYWNTLKVGPADCVIRDPDTNEYHRLDIKTINYFLKQDGKWGRKHGDYPTRRKDQHDVEFLFVAPGIGCAFEVRDLDKVVAESQK